MVMVGLRLLQFMEIVFGMLELTSLILALRVLIRLITMSVGMLSPSAVWYTSSGTVGAITFKLISNGIVTIIFRFCDIFAVTLGFLVI